LDLEQLLSGRAALVVGHRRRLELRDLDGSGGA
jgi:hypothetical protein